LIALLVIIFFSVPKETGDGLYFDYFIDHLKRNAPSNPECFVQKMRERWHTQAELFDSVNQERFMRGEADAINFVIRKYKNECLI
jgi:hypothetical protein